MLQGQYLIPIKRSFLVFINFFAALKNIILICIFVLGRNINCDWAISKSKFCKKLEKDLENQETQENQEDKNGEQSSQDTQKEDNDIQEKVRKEKDNLKKQKRRKLHKIKKQKKRARIVIRNLAFEVFIMYY